MRQIGVTRQALPRFRDAALVAAVVAALAVLAGAALIGSMNANVPAPAQDAPSAAPQAPVHEQAPVQPSAPAAPTQAPALTAAPAAPTGEAPQVQPTRLPFESLPIERANRSFVPGNPPPPYASVPPQN